MAEADKNTPETPKEVFTDLHGNPDPVPDKVEVGDGELDLVDRALASRVMTEMPVLATPGDDELEVVPEPEPAPVEEVFPETPEAEEPPPPAIEEPAEEAPQPEPAAEEFDPKDVQLIARDAKNLELRKAQATSAQTQATTALERSKAAYLAAQEAGDSKGAVAAWEEFADAKIAAANAANDLRGIGDEENRLRTEFEALIAKAPKDAAGKPILDRRVDRRQTLARPTSTATPSKLISKFLAANPWFSDPKNAARATVLRGLDQELASERKLNKDDPKYFAELGARFNKMYPGVYRGLDGKPIATGQRQRGNGAGDGNTAPVNAGGGSGTNRAVTLSPKEIRLTNADLDQMDKFGLDRQNKDHLRRWLTEKRAMAMQGVN